jgi:AraC-like DNA-binding protein
LAAGWQAFTPPVAASSDNNQGAVKSKARAFQWDALLLGTKALLAVSSGLVNRVILSDSNPCGRIYKIHRISNICQKGLILATVGRQRFQPMRYREFHPKPPLNSVIECLWTLENDTDDPASRTERILPDGCIELILNFGARFLQHIDDTPQLQPQTFIAGQLTKPLLITPTGPVQLIGIRFHPGGTSPFFRLPMHELTNQVVELGGFARALEVSLLATSNDLPSVTEKVFALQRVLTQLLLKNKSDLRLLKIAERVVESAGMTPVETLAFDAGISCRQLERRFLAQIGLGPKLLSRILRFQQVFRAVDANEPSWPTVALDCGYYDQAHLIKDFRQFAQQTPSMLFAEQSSFTESFTRKARTSDFSNTTQFERI